MTQAVPIQAIYCKNFRGLKSTQILACGRLNIFIGKNNSGKSTALAAIQTMHDHLREGNIARDWPEKRWQDEFTGKDTSLPLQIAIEFAPDSSVLSATRAHLLDLSPQIARAIDELPTNQTIAILLRLIHHNGNSFQYVESITIGSIDASGAELRPTGIPLFHTPLVAAEELYKQLRDINRLERRVNIIERLHANPSFPPSSFTEQRSPSAIRFALDRFGMDIAPPLRRDIQTLVESSRSSDEFQTNLLTAASQDKDEIEKIRSKETSIPMTSFVGEVRSQPIYVCELLRALGSTPLIHLRERKQPIGAEEAERLLKLKIRRGGNEKLLSVQQTVRSLLGVNLDAFQTTEESRQPGAEMDVDDFLAEANGAGVREALRLILDLELGDARIVLLEEPEVHLHPGLEFAVHSYLQKRSDTQQIFLTTHSTNFIDLVSPQNIYLFSKDSARNTVCERVGEEDAPVKIPSELGLRLSTVFMFDKLVFVEGPSDEAVLREFASKEAIDLAKAGVAFVHLGGIKNFTHYAAEGTLDLLSRRRIKMWFVVDRDERTDADVTAMLARLGQRAPAACSFETRP